jgi:hypothetical protein
MCQDEAIEPVEPGVIRSDDPFAHTEAREDLQLFAAPSTDLDLPAISNSTIGIDDKGPVTARPF